MLQDLQQDFFSPFKYSRGNGHIMVMYDYDANVILAKSFKTRQSNELAKTLETIYIELTKNGHNNKYYVLDNKCLADLKQALKNMI